jgi:putative FmdB family regulatory protein
MPIYEYRCEKCGEFELSQRITEPALQRCPTCKRKVRRLISNTSFQLKGSAVRMTSARGAAEKAPDGAKDALTQSSSASETPHSRAPRQPAAESNEVDPGPASKKSASAERTGADARRFVGVDTGGTLTDVPVVDGQAPLQGRSTLRDPAEAVLAGLARLLERRGRAGSWVDRGHECARTARRRVALVTTAGFETGSIGWQTRLRPRSRLGSVRALVERRCRIGVAMGRPRWAHCAARPREVRGWSRSAGHAPTRPSACSTVCAAAHERVPGGALPHMHVTLAHELNREYREYERVSTAAVNAYVGPLMARHLSRLEAGARGRLRSPSQLELWRRA